MVKVVLAGGGLVVLLLVEHLVEGVHGQEGDPRHAQLLDDGVGHGRLTTGAAAADADQERLNQLPLAIVPEGWVLSWLLD